MLGRESWTVRAFVKRAPHDPRRRREAARGHVEYAMPVVPIK